MIESSDFLSMDVEIIIDRPMGSKHPDHGYVYPVNYGYVPNTTGSDGEPIDVYILGEAEPLTRFEGIKTSHLLASSLFYH